MYGQQQFRCQPAVNVGRPVMEASPSFSFLNQLTTDEIENLERDQERIYKLIEDDEQVRRQQSEKENLLATNKSLAEYNLSLEPKLNQSKILLSQTHEQAVEVSKKYEKSRMLMEATPLTVTSDVKLALLQTEAAKVEEECENITDDFLSGKIDVDGFISSYVEKRTLATVRKIKCEKMADILRQSSNQRRQSAPAPSLVAVKPTPPLSAVPGGYSAYVNTAVGGGAPSYPPYPVSYPLQQPGSYVPYGGMPSYSAAVSMGMPYMSNLPGSYPQPSLH